MLGIKKYLQKNNFDKQTQAKLLPTKMELCDGEYRPLQYMLLEFHRCSQDFDGVCIT